MDPSRAAGVTEPGKIDRVPVLQGFPHTPQRPIGARCDPLEAEARTRARIDSARATMSVWLRMTPGAPIADDPPAEPGIGRVVRIRTGHINLQRWFVLAIRLVGVMTGLTPSPGRPDADASRLIARWCRIAVGSQVSNYTRVDQCIVKRRTMPILEDLRGQVAVVRCDPPQHGLCSVVVAGQRCEVGEKA